MNLNLLTLLIGFVIIVLGLGNIIDSLLNYLLATDILKEMKKDNEEDSKNE